MARFSAVLDACVLVPIVQADTLLRLAETGLYRPLWTRRILDETVRALEHIHPDMKESNSARNRAEIMNDAFEDACVEEWEHLLEVIELPDEDDRHVVAAAIQGRADLIITTNLKDFPPPVLRKLNVEAQHPDEFLMNQLDLDPESVMTALHLQASATQNPVLTVSDVLGRLERCGASQFCDAARRQMWRLPNANLAH